VREVKSEPAGTASRTGAKPHPNQPYRVQQRAPKPVSPPPRPEGVKRPEDTGRLRLRLASLRKDSALRKGAAPTEPRRDASSERTRTSETTPRAGFAPPALNTRAGSS